MIIHLEHLLSDGLPAAIRASRVDSAHNLVRPTVGLFLPSLGGTLICVAQADCLAINSIENDVKGVNNVFDLYGRLKFRFMRISFKYVK